VLLLAAGAARAQDWPQWRGPERDGIARGLAAPAKWPQRLDRIWQLEVGAGHATPIVAGDLVFVLTREGEQETARALRLQDGALVWQQSYAAPYTMNSAATSHGKGPKSTPLYALGKLFTFGISGILSAFDAASGKPLWRKTFEHDFAETSPLYGTAMSPMVEGGRLIVHAGGHHDGALLALDPERGTVRWRLAGDGPGYASPIAVTIQGTRQIVTQTDQRVLGVRAEDGELLWSLPLITPYDQNIVTPIALGSRLILSGLEQGVWAIEPSLDGGRWQPTALWHLEAVSSYMSTPVAIGGLLLGLAHQRRGQLFALDPAGGELRWSSAGREGEQAALVVLGDHVLVLTEDAELRVLRPPGFMPIARYSVADTPTWAHPVPTAAGLLIKDRSALSLLRIGG
jgi:outer membrane protein assembly factor BamB